MSMFSITSSMSIEKKKKKKFLMVTDYIHLPDRNMLSSIEYELKGFLFVIYVYKHYFCIYSIHLKKISVFIEYLMMAIFNYI